MRMQIDAREFSHHIMVMKNFEFSSLQRLICLLFLTSRVLVAASVQSLSTGCGVEFTSTVCLICIAPSGEPRGLKTLFHPIFRVFFKDVKLGQGGLKNRSLSAFNQEYSKTFHNSLKDVASLSTIFLELKIYIYISKIYHQIFSTLF